MKKKIYISKSKAASPDKIISAKEIIKKIYPEAEILEFQGGPYTTEKLDAANIVFVVTPSPIHYFSNDDTTAVFSIGAGNFQETIRAFGNNVDVFFILHENGNELLKYKTLPILKGKDITSINELPESDSNKNYQKSFGRITFKKKFLNWPLTDNSTKILL